MKGAVAVIICSIERSTVEVFYWTYRLESSSLRDRAVKKVCILSYGVSSSGSSYVLIGHRCSNRVLSSFQRNLQLKFHWETWFVEGDTYRTTVKSEPNWGILKFRVGRPNDLCMSKVLHLAYSLFEKIGSS